MTVHPLADGDFSLSCSQLESVLYIVGNIPQDCGEWNLVETAFWRPLLLMLVAGSNKAGEAVGTVVVAWYFDNFSAREFVQTGHAFARPKSAFVR